MTHTPSTPMKPDPTLDLVLERIIDVPPNLVWAAWTQPEHLREWFVPRPWSVVECEIDLKPGGRFRTVMRSPEGQDSPSLGCFLEIVPEERLVFTDSMLPGFRPADGEFLGFTAIISIVPEGSGTRYTATALHRNEEGRKRHEEMGFHEGWGAALDQLVEYAKAM